MKRIPPLDDIPVVDDEILYGDAEEELRSAWRNYNEAFIRMELLRFKYKDDESLIKEIDIIESRMKRVITSAEKIYLEKAEIDQLDLPYEIEKKLREYPIHTLCELVNSTTYKEDAMDNILTEEEKKTLEEALENFGLKFSYGAEGSPFIDYKLGDDD